MQPHLPSRITRSDRSERLAFQKRSFLPVVSKVRRERGRGSIELIPWFRCIPSRLIFPLIVGRPLLTGTYHFTPWLEGSSLSLSLSSRLERAVKRGSRKNNNAEKVGSFQRTEHRTTLQRTLA